MLRTGAGLAALAAPLAPLAAVGPPDADPDRGAGASDRLLAEPAEARASARGTAAGSVSVPAGAVPFAFGLIGDLPYADRDEAQLAALLAHMDDEPLAFAIHAGDIKGSREPCSDALYLRRRALLERSAHPLVLLPGDNEWLDCHRRAAGAHDPRERLAALRRILWEARGPLGGDRTAARAPLLLERQPRMPENVRWRIGAVHFAALHVVGSNNGLDEYPGSRAEFDARLAANRAWLDDWLEGAKRDRADALVLAFHADPGFDSARSAGFGAFKRWLQDLAAGFRGQVLLVHGDSHRFRVDRPLEGRDGRIVEHVTRVVCFGHPFIHAWVRIAYDPDAPARFAVGIREVRAAPP
jgi:hypothetical protein